MVSSQHISKTVRRMCSLWFKHCTWFRKQKPVFPTSFEDKASKSFMRYKERMLRGHFGDIAYNQLNDKQRDRFFFKNLWRGRSVYHYDYKMSNGYHYLNTTEKRLPKTNFRNFFENKQLKSKINDLLTIKESKTTKLIGITPFPVGGQPQKVTYPPKMFREYIEIMPNKEIYDPKFHDTATIGGSWGSQIVDFQKLCDPVDHEVTYKDYLDVIDKHGDKIGLPFLSPPKVGDLNLVKTNQNAGTGLISSRLFGSQHKRADRYALRVAQTLFNRTAVNVSCDVSCWSIGGRARKQKVWKDAPLRSRIILMPEAPNKILGLSYAQRIYNGFSMVNWRNYRSEVRIGNNDFHGNYIWYDEYMNKKDTEFVEFDISAHDARTAEITMVVAFGVLRSMFPESNEIDNHFLYFMSGTIYKNVATPGRFIYKCTKGIPSGSPFTSILTSVVNWLNCRSFISKNALDQDYSSMVHVFGDDTLIRFSNESMSKNPKMRDPSFWANGFQTWCGHILDPIHIKKWGTNHPDDSPSFLKTYSWNGFPARRAADSLLSASTIRKGNLSFTRYSNVIKGLCYASPFDPVGLAMLEDYRRWLLVQRIERGPSYNDLTHPVDRREIDRQINVTYRALSLQHLMPRVYGIEIVKNVDLGNKPSMTVKPGPYNEQWVDDIMRDGIYHVEYSTPHPLPTTIDIHGDNLWQTVNKTAKFVISILMLLRVIYTMKKF